MKQQLHLVAITVAIISVVIVSIGRTDRAGYVNLQVALNETQEWKTASADINQDAQKKAGELNEANAAVKKAEETNEPAESVKAKREAAEAVARRLADEKKTRQEQAGNRVLSRLLRLLPGIAADRGMKTINNATVYVSPDLDVTQELIKRANASEGEAPPGKGP